MHSGYWQNGWSRIIFIIFTLKNLEGYVVLCHVIKGRDIFEVLVASFVPVIEGLALSYSICSTFVQYERRPLLISRVKIHGQS